MATVTSYGSITIVDITDIGEFSVYPRCTLPTTVIYSPDSGTNGTYTPDWATNNLVITPVAYYAGAPQTTGITWTWERQEGLSGTRTTVVSGQNNETIASNGTLTVSANKFPAGSTYSQLTYIVTATYPDSQSGLGRNLVAEGQITFSKIQQGTSAKVARINGDNIIKYASDGSITSPLDANQKSYITLTGTVVNCTISGWKYKNGNSWSTYPTKTSASPATYPSGSTGATLNVYEDDSVFSGDRVTIKLETNDNDTFDEFTIYKLRDGAAGTSSLTAVLTNEDQMIPANSNGSPINIAQSGATSQIKILRGGVDVTSSEGWSISTSSDTGITFTRSATARTNDTVTVTGMSNELTAGNIYFTATHTVGSTTETLNKTFSLVKVKGGADASTFTIYNLNIDALALNYDGTSFTPPSFTASAFQTVVSAANATTSAFSQAKWKITESYNNGNSDVVKVATSATAAATKTYTPSGPTVSKIKVELYDSSGTNKLDSQTVVVTTDGADGEQGPQGNPGNDAVSILLGNEAEVFACNNSNYPLNQIIVSIPFGAYKGTTRTAASVTSVQLLGINPHSDSHAADSSRDGLIKYVIPTTKQITNSSGFLNLEFTCEGQTFNKVFSWTRSSAAKDGIDGVTMLLFTPDGTLFENGTGEITVEGYLQSGITNVTNSATWKWYQYLPNNANPPVYDYTELPTTAGTQQNPNYAYYSGKDLTVLPNAINGYGSFKVTAVYNNGSGNKTYTQYISLTDKTDPIQVSIHSTLGTQLVNGQGSGALYVRVTRSGEEIDPIGDTAISAGTANPSGGDNGDHYIKLDETNKIATLYYKDGGSWKVQPLTATYEWSFRNAQNQPITDSATLTNKFKNAYSSTTGKVTGKCLYLDKTTVDNKITADVKVTV